MEEVKRPGPGGPDGRPKFGMPPEAPVSQKNDSNAITREYYDQFMIEYRYLDAVQPDMTLSLFGETFSTPILVGGLSAVVPRLHPNGMLELAYGAKAVNTAFFTGYLQKEEITELCKTGAKTARIIKTMRDRDRVFADIKSDEESGAYAFALDIDHGFDNQGNYYHATPDYGELGPITTKELAEYCASTTLPCVVKGVLSVADAVKAAEAGAAAVLLSHHKGEVPDAVPPLFVLPEIKAAVGDKVKVLVDCGITSGIDAFKALAMGADAVCVARTLMAPYKDEGREGVARRLSELTLELRGVMARTGSPDILHIDPTTVRRKTW